jgi:hypothetical protein
VDLAQADAVVSGLTSAVGIIATTWRHRMRDRDDIRLRLRVLEANPAADVLTDLPALRRAERWPLRDK